MFKTPSLFAKILFVAAMLTCLLPQVNSATALIVGIFFALSIGNPFLAFTQKNTSYLLQASVVGLGAGMNLAVVGQVGLEGIGYTAIGIVLAIGFGILFGRLLRTEPNTSLLICVGTAICGGSAIAAVAPTIRAKAHEVSIALAIVFFLNATALLIFPGIGHALGLSQREFGLLSALAIHDTSSVVGAAMSYGSEAVNIATTVKLARALWIIPVALTIGLMWRTTSTTKAKRPWFILGFLIAAALVTYVPALQSAGEIVNQIAKRLLVLTLFLIGAGLTPAAVKSVGVKPLVQGLALWIVVTTATLGALLMGWIR